MAKPFTPDTLADRWECSPETIRQMIRNGTLLGFRTGSACQEALPHHRRRPGQALGNSPPSAINPPAVSTPTPPAP